MKNCKPFLDLGLPPQVLAQTVPLSPDLAESPDKNCVILEVVGGWE